MSDRELLSLFRRASKDLDASQRAQIRRLRGIERTLFEEIVKALVDELMTQDGRITSRRGEVSLSQAIDRIFNALDRGPVNEFAKASLSDLGSILKNNVAYNKGLYEGTPGKFKDIEQKVRATMRKRLGITDSGTMKGGGFLDRLFTSEPVRQEVKRIVASGVSAGIPVSKLTKQLDVAINGTQDVDGAMTRYYRGFVFDTYQQFDRATNDLFAVRLDLSFFIYEGGLIETSREFCEKRNGKVFTVKEANRDWPRDKSLPRTTKENQSGVLVDYVPTQDMGRWNCRHRTRYISEQMARRLAPEKFEELQQAA